jgi:hypothetical protein
MNVLIEVSNLTSQFFFLHEMSKEDLHKKVILVANVANVTLASGNDKF